MQRSITVSLRLILGGALLAILAVFGTMALAQDRPELPDDPEGGRESAQSNGSAADLEEAEASQVPDGETQLYKFISGATFHPREAVTTHAYGGAGCLYKTSQSGFFIKDLQLPDGAIVDGMRLYYNDVSSNENAELYLYSFDGTGGFQLISQVSSLGAPGQSSINSAAFSHTVDNAVRSLALVAGTQGATDSSVSICGARITYRIPIPSLTLLPAILKETLGGG